MPVIAVVPFLVMKTAAMGRGKAKDAYDIYFIIKHYFGGIEQLAKEFSDCSDVPNFLDLVNDEETEMTRRDVFEQAQTLLSMI